MIPESSFGMYRSNWVEKERVQTASRVCSEPAWLKSFDIDSRVYGMSAGRSKGSFVFTVAFKVGVKYGRICSMICRESSKFRVMMNS